MKPVNIQSEQVITPISIYLDPASIKERLWNLRIEPTKNEKIYLSIGSGTKREGTTNNEDHRFIGVGFENYFRKDPDDSSPGQVFVKLYGQIIEYKDIEGPDFIKDELPMAGIMLGIKF